MTEKQITLVSIVGCVWALAGLFVLLWWQDLGAEQFNEFVGRSILVTLVALGVTMTAIVGALVSRPN